ncbi:MAG: PAS domain S-box protein [Desulfovibrio sp.]|nr:PAS domain S-box protein [Desulfovibrio sp.]
MDRDEGKTREELVTELRALRERLARRQAGQGPHNASTGRVEFEAFFDASPFPASFLDRNFVYQAVNAAYERYLGIGRRELIGLTPADLLPADVVERMKPYLERCLNGEDVVYDMWFDFPAMGRRCMGVGYHPRRGEKGEVIGILHISRDITEHVVAKERIKEERGRLEAILASLDTGLSLINRDLTVAWVNDKITNMFPGPTPVGAVCHTCYAGREDPCPECPAIRAFRSGHVERGERHDPDSGKWYSIIAQPVKDAAGNTIQVLEGITDSTSRRRAEETLARSESKWRHILANAPQIGISLDPRGKLTFANDHFLKLTGWKRDEVIGKDWFAIFIPESIRSEIRRVFDTTMAQRHIHGYSNYENEILHRNGSLLTINWSNVLTLDLDGHPVDVTCMGIDVTERRRTEEALLQAKQEFEGIFENSQVGIMLLQGGRVLARGNHRLADLLGYESPEEMVGRSTREIHLDEEHFVEFGRRYYEALTRNEQNQVEYRLRKKDGTPVWCILSGKALDPGDLDKGVIWVVDDLSRRKALEEQLTKARDAAEAANQAKSEFLANMSHEIRTPLNGIMGMLHLLGTTPINDEQKEYVSTAVRSCRRLTRLLSDILDLSRVEAGKMEISMNVFELRDVMDAVVQLFSPTAKEKKLGIRARIDPDIPATLKGDAARLQQVLGNLVGNAIKFTAKGRVEIDAHALPPRNPGECRVLFSVADTGIGIPDDKLEMLFMPFTQVNQGYTRDYQGAGLGLSICKRLVGLMGGNIAVESVPGEGTTVYFCVAFGIAEPARAVPPPARARDAHPRALSILFAEDDQVNRLSTMRLAEKSGHRVVAVETGRQALDALKDGDFDIVLMDVQMPDMDGLEATRRIRNGEAGGDKADIPIVALTAYTMAGDREKFIAAGIDGYLAKPLALEELQKALIEVLEGRAISS